MEDSCTTAGERLATNRSAWDDGGAVSTKACASSSNFHEGSRQRQERMGQQIDSVGTSLPPLARCSSNTRICLQSHFVANLEERIKPDLFVSNIPNHGTSTVAYHYR